MGAWTRVAVVLVSAAALSPVAGAATSPGRGEPLPLPQPAPTGTSEIPLSVRYVEASSAGVAWEVRGRWGPGDDDLIVHYTSFSGGPADVVAGPVAVTADEAGISAPDYAFAGSQLRIAEPSGDVGIDIDTGAQLPTLHHACWWRAGPACLTIERDAQSDWQFRLIDDNGSARTFPAPLIDGTSTPTDLVRPVAVDATGAVVQASGPRTPGSPEDAVLTYLDFTSGTYTTLDDSSSAASDRPAMDATDVAWTHNGRVRYLDRADLTATPGVGAAAVRVADIALSGDILAYVVKGGGLHTGPLGGTDFAVVTGPRPLGPILGIGGGDFAISAGRSALDYGLYRLRPGHSQAGPLIALYGFARLDQDRTVPTADLNADGRSALATVSREGAWAIHGQAPIQLGTRGDVPVALDNASSVARPAVFRPGSGRWFIRSVAGSVHSVEFGGAGGIPVPAQYAGRGRPAVLATFQPATARWHVRGRSAFTYGHPGDVPVPGHYVGRVDHAAVFRPGSGSWCVRGSGCISYGKRGDVPVPGDYNGDGRTDVAVYRPADHSWHIWGRSPVRFGRAGDVPLRGDFDGDGRADIAVYRPSTHEWRVHRVGVFRFGRGHGRPLEAAVS